MNLDSYIQILFILFILFVPVASSEALKRNIRKFYEKDVK